MKVLKCLTPSQWVALLSVISLSNACSSVDSPDFATDVAPVIFKNCSPCHRPDGGAPFSLLTYKDAAKRAKMIALVTRTKYMPPWPADRTYSHFISERFLTDEQIQMFKEWYVNNCPPGDTTGLKAPDWVFKSYALGTPDTVLSVPPINILNDNRDKFYVVKIPYKMASWKSVRAVEFVPGKPEYAHHVNGHYLRFNETTNPFKGNRIVNIESENYSKEFEALSLLNDDGTAPERVHSAVNYLPGAFGVRYPEGIGGFMMSPNGAFVANDIHYGPSIESLTDSSRLFIYFSKSPPKRPCFEVMMGTNGVADIVPPLQVPAGKITKHVSEMTIYNDISILTVNPHMHLIGKSFKAYAVKPNGDTVHLIHIPRWQFRWQYFYTFTHPVRVPKGSTIRVEAEFDNTSNNPDNPYDPPRPIGERLDRGGASMRTTDEMLQFIITYMPYQKGDESIDLSNP